MARRRQACGVPLRLRSARREPHRDIPDWLYEKTKDGKDYDISYGKGYSPNYANRVFTEAHAKAVAALGKRFGQDTFFSYVELGSLGHWGEWHIKTGEGLVRAGRGHPGRIRRGL